MSRQVPVAYFLTISSRQSVEDVEGNIYVTPPPPTPVPTRSSDTPLQFERAIKLATSPTPVGAATGLPFNTPSEDPISDEESAPCLSLYVSGTPATCYAAE